MKVRKTNPWREGVDHFDIFLFYVNFLELRRREATPFIRIRSNDGIAGHSKWWQMVLTQWCYSIVMLTFCYPLMSDENHETRLEFGGYSPVINT